MSIGKCIIFSAPSGSGKTTLVKYLLGQNELNLIFSISATTRKKRNNEKNKVDYIFLDSPERLRFAKNTHNYLVDR